MLPAGFASISQTSVTGPCRASPFSASSSPSCTASGCQEAARSKVTGRAQAEPEPPTLPPLVTLRAAVRGFGAAFPPLPPSSWADDVQPVTATDTATSTAVTVPRTELRTTKIPCPRP